VIVVDTSAVVAILFGEPEAATLRALLARETDARISAVTDYETRLIAFHRQGEEAVADYQTMVEHRDFTITTFDQAHSTLAYAAYRRFGKGNHAARLNFADCAAYALARSLDAPLLFKGADFALTDVRVAA
jgi:ribonuclease VapC